MKIQNEQTKLLIGFMGITLTLMLTVASPAFANSSTNNGNYSPNYATPTTLGNGQPCSGSSGQFCAAVTSSGNDELYSIATCCYYSATAYANNNYDPTNTPHFGTSPSLSSSGPTIYYKAKVTFGYDITNPSGSNFNAYYEIHPILADSTGAVASCFQDYDSAGVQSTISVTVPCTYSSSSSDTYYEGLETYGYTYDDGSGTMIVNMWNSANGYDEDATSLEVCDTSPC